MSKKHSEGGSFERNIGWPNQVLELTELMKGEKYELWSITGSKGVFEAASVPYKKRGKWVLDIFFIYSPGTLYYDDGKRTIELENYGMVPYDDGSFHRTHYIRNFPW